MTKLNIEPKGFNIEHTYKVQMIKKEADETKSSQDAKSQYEEATIMVERIRNYPGVEAVSLSVTAAPYTDAMMGGGYMVNADSVLQQARVGAFTADFFKVFQLDLLQGSITEWDKQVSEGIVVINGNYNNTFQDYALNDVSTVTPAKMDRSGQKVNVVGIVNRTKDVDDTPDQPHVYRPIFPNESFRLYPDISIRVSPDSDKDFVKRFSKDMYEPLSLDTYSMGSILSYQDVRKARMRITNSEKNSVYAITGFMIANIFLGVIGTFWFRTQSRRNEIGLRMAIGSSKKRIKKLLIGETCLIMFMASIAGTLISLYLAQTEILSGLGLPRIDREYAQVLPVQDIINYLITIGFLLLVAIIAVHYPARRAAKIQHAETLHEE
jgi:putative ABC transport system permease protein